MKLLGAELRAGDYAADARLTQHDYRKSQTNSTGVHVALVDDAKAGGKIEKPQFARVSHVRAQRRVDDELQRAITKLITIDAIVIAGRCFSTVILTLLWVGDSSVVDADTVQ